MSGLPGQTPDFDDPLWELLEAECEGRLTAEQRTALDARLASDESAKYFYVRYMNVHARLLWLSRGKTQIIPQRSPSLSVDAGDNPGADEKNVLQGRKNAEAVKPRVLPARRQLLGLVGAALVASLLAGALYLGVALWSASPPEPTVAVARLVRIVGAVWAAHPQAAARSDQAVNEALPIGRKLQLQAGLAEIEFRSGARVVLEGPAEFIVGARAAPCFLSFGKLTAHVPPYAAGFSIASPTLTAVDRGTEFGMFVRRREPANQDQGSPNADSVAFSTEVHVLLGQVEVAAKPDVNASPVAGPTSEIVSAGNAVRVDLHGAVQATPASPDEFLAPRALLNHRVVVLEDDFNDGDLARNPDGVGGGFDLSISREPYTTVAEADGAAQLRTVEGRRFWKKSSIPLELRSRDRFSAEGARFEWRLRAAQSPHVVLALVSEDEQSQMELRIYSPLQIGQPNLLTFSAWNDPKAKVEYFSAPCQAASEKPFDWTQDIVVVLELERDGFVLSWKPADGAEHVASGKWADKQGFDSQRFFASGRRQLRMRPEPTRGVASAMLLDKVIVTAPR